MGSFFFTHVHYYIKTQDDPSNELDYCVARADCKTLEPQGVSLNKPPFADETRPLGNMLPCMQIIM